MPLKITRSRRAPAVPGKAVNAFGCLAMCVLVLLSGGCAKRESAPAHADRLSIALLQEPVSLDPLLLEGPIAYAVSELFYTYLTNYDAAGNMVPDVALQVPTPENGGVSADGTRITFHLRRGVRWQDGASLTARDIVFTYRAIMNPNNAIPERYGYDKIVSIAAPDPYTVVIRLKRPFAPIVPLFFGGDSNYPILPEHVLGKYASLNKVPFNEAPIGSGPYKLDAWAHGERLVLSANPLYYRGEPAIRRLELPFIHDPSTTINELVTHEVDAAFSLDASRISLLRTLPAHRIVVTPIPYFYAIAFNTSDPVLRDAAVRRAVALAVDRQSIVRKVSHSVYDAETGLRGLFTWAFDPAADGVRYNPRLAEELLQREGWTARPDGTRWKDGKRLQLQLAFPTGSDITAQFATAIAAAEASIGVDVVLKRYSREVYMLNDGPVMQGRFQMQLYDYHSNYDPDAAWLLACDQISPNGFNDAKYCNTSVDRALSAASSSFERTLRSRMYAQVQRRVAADLPYFFLCQASEIDVIPANLEHYDRPLLSPFNSVQRWALSIGVPSRGILLREPGVSSRR
jgi:peptide/nickel transport system substrate-binding protein